MQFFKGLSNLGIKGTVTAVLIEALLNMKVAGTDVTGAVGEHRQRQDERDGCVVCQEMSNYIIQVKRGPIILALAGQAGRKYRGQAVLADMS